MIRLTAIPLAALLAMPSSAFAQSCTGNPVSVQILGSGGPGFSRDRASASYLLWVGSQAKILVDMGGGAFSRFGQAQAKFGDLSMIAISHLHPDHVSDLPALLWAGRNPARTDSLPIFGPSGNDVAPSIATFLNRLFDEKNGAFQVLGSAVGAMPGNAGSIRLAAGVVDVTKPEPSIVFDREGMTVTALAIPHDGIPTLAYRVQTRGMSTVFSSDQIGTNPRFIDFAKDANILIMHLAIAAGASSSFHASPAVVGRVAQGANVRRLIVSHIAQFDLAAAIAELRKSYSGALTVGADLQCTPVE